MRKSDGVKRSVKEKLSDILDLGSDIILDIPHFVINDNREVQIENYKSILEYEDNTIKLGAKDYLIIVIGKKLQIVAITDEEIIIKGIISSISFTN